MPRDKRLSLPDEPGIYRLLRSNGEVLYVGKASSLKKRVNSYFQKQRRISERTLEMLTQAQDLGIVARIGLQLATRQVLAGLTRSSPTPAFRVVPFG